MYIVELNILLKKRIEMECYIEYLDPKNKFQKTTKDFETYEKAYQWMIENFEKPNVDMIRYYYI